MSDPVLTLATWAAARLDEAPMFPTQPKCIDCDWALEPQGGYELAPCTKDDERCRECCASRPVELDDCGECDADLTALERSRRACRVAS